jgi:CheY-like chemotaxis protein
MAKKALVVDNDFFFVEFLTELLEKKGYEITKAYDGKEGISRLEESTFDVLFTDLIMPKIDGLQLIKFARKRFPSGRLSIIVASGTLIEQMDDIQNIGADYCVVKGPLEEMTENIGGLLDNLGSHVEGQRVPEQKGEKFVDPGKLYPRLATSELVEELNFQKAVFDSVGIGILVVDRDARVMVTNAMALELLKKPMENVLNFRITDVFPQEGRGRLVKALKTVAQNLDLKRHRFQLNSGSGVLRLMVTMLRMGNDLDGWILTMEGMDP